MEALFRGPLVVKDGCVLVGQPGEYSLPIWWNGFTAEPDPSAGIIVRDADGTVVAVEGRTFEMGGGYRAEFYPGEEPRDVQLQRVEEWLGYEIPDRCLTPDVYGIWLVGETEPGSRSESDASGGGIVPGAGRPLIDLFDPSQDLLSGGRVISVAGAARLVPYQMYLPSDVALPAPEVWVLRYIAEDGTPSYDAAARFDASVVVTYGMWTNGRDPATEYQKMHAETPTGYLTTISGNPARVVPAGSPQTVDRRISVVNLSIGDVEVTLFGRVPVDDLIQYASTLQPV